MRKPLISATAEMSGFVLVEAPAPSPGEHKMFWYAALRTSATRLQNHFAALMQEKTPARISAAFARCRAI